MPSARTRRRAATRGAVGRVCCAVLASVGLFGCDSDPAEPANPEAARWIRQLDTGNVEKRAEAIAELAAIDDACVIGPLLETARTDNQWNLRVEAIRALAREGVLRDPGPLISLLADPKKEIRQTVCEALGRLKAPAAEDALVERLGDPDPGVRLAAIRALGRLGEAGRARLGKLLDSGKVDERLAIIEVVGVESGAGWTDSLIAILKEPRSDLRRAAADALGRLKAPQAVGPLAELIREPLPQTQQQIKRTIQRHIGRTRHSGLKAILTEAYEANYPVPVLRARLAREWWEGIVNPLRALIAEVEPEPRLTRQVAMAALVKIEGPVTEAALTELLAFGDPDVVAMVASVMVDRSPRLLADLATDRKRSAEVREQALRALVGCHVASESKTDAEKLAEVLRTGGAPAAPDAAAPVPLSKELRELLEAGLRDPSESVRAYCAGQLALRKIESASEPLLALLKSGDHAAKLAAVRGLAHYEDARALDELLAILRETKATRAEPPAKDLRRAVLGTLAAVGDKRGVKDVLEIATDPKSPLLTEAIGAVGAMGDPSVGEALLALREQLARELEAANKAKDKQRARTLSGAANAALRALGRAKARQAVPALIRVMQGDPRRGPVHEAMEALGDMGDPAAVEPIIQRLRTGPHRKKLDRHANYTTQAGINALVKLGDARAVELFKQYVASPPDDPTYNYAFDALGKLKVPASAELLAGYLLREDMDIAVKSAKVGPALAALGSVAKPVLLRLLVEAPKKPETSTYDAGVFAAQLLAMLDEEVLPDLARIAGAAKEQHVLGRVVVAAANMRTVKAVGLLAGLVKHGDTQVRLWAAGALGGFAASKRDAARPILQAAASGSDPEVAKWAAEALRRWDTQAASQPASQPGPANVTERSG